MVAPHPKPCLPLPADDLEHVLAHTAPLWEQARGQRFFITGGTGFFGMWLLESFAYINDSLKLGATVTVLTRDPAAFVAKAPHLSGRADLHFSQGDIRGFEFPAGKFHYLIHAATEVAGGTAAAAAPDRMLDAIIDGTRRVLDFAAAAGVKKLLLTSSGAAYGRQPPALSHLPEEHLGAPDSTLDTSGYGEGKRVAELLAAIRSRREGYEVKIARCFAFVGPHLPLDSVYAIGNFIGNVMTGQPIRIAGDGTPRRSYLYAADLAVWLWTLLFIGPAQRIYNVGSDVDLSIGDLAELVKATLQSSSTIEIANPAAPGLPITRYVPSVERAARELGLHVHVGLPEAILKTARWHRAGHPTSLHCHE